jgi:hypothetical protein
MAVLIGSMALRHWCPKVDRNSDYDIILSNEEYKHIASEYTLSKRGHKSLLEYEGVRYEIETDDKQSNRMILEYPSPSSIQILGLEFKVATLGILLALKRSHRYLPNHWHKNIRDYHFLKKRTQLDEHLLHISNTREAEYTVRTTKYSLNVSNDHFFKASQHAVGRLYEHDDIHQATCFYDAPLWSRCKSDLSKAYISKNLFDKLSIDDQIKMVQEEAFVIALERMVLPNNQHPLKAFKYAIMRICTDLTRGWFREFAVEHYFEIMDHNVDFVFKFKEALQSGKIRQSENPHD